MLPLSAQVVTKPLANGSGTCRKNKRSWGTSGGVMFFVCAVEMHTLFCVQAAGAEA